MNNNQISYIHNDLLNGLTKLEIL